MDKPPGNYVDQLVKRIVNDPGFAKPGLMVVNVLHDKWCDLLHKRGPCNCNPVIEEPIREEQA